MKSLNADQLEKAIAEKDKYALYNYHLQKNITDDQLLKAIIKIDNSVDTRKINWVKFFHDVFFPSAKAK